MKVKLKPIKTDEDYQKALKRIDELIEAEEGTPEFEELDKLSDLVWEYEEENNIFPVKSKS